jgi:P27 family predicted phage terminase small subunit
MGRRGPAPKPTAHKRMTGNPGKRPLNKSEPQPLLITPNCPEFLDEAAKLKWKELAPELERLGLLTTVDGDSLAGYCQAWAEFRQATETLQKEGRHIRVGGMPVVPVDDEGGEKPMEWRGGQHQSHPAVAQQRTAWAAMVKFGSLFGLDPSSRSRLTVDDKQPKPSKVEARKRG